MGREGEEIFAGEIEVDESYFGGSRKGNRGRGAAGKVPVFGLLKRGGKVYTNHKGCFIIHNALSLKAKLHLTALFTLMAGEGIMR